MQRTLIYLLFVITVIFFLAVHSKKLEKITLWKGFIKDTSGTNLGDVEIKKRSDGSEVLIIKLKKGIAREVVVLVQLKEHIGIEVGRFKGASFIITLPNRIKANKISAIQLISANNGRILAESSLDLNKINP